MRHRPHRILRWLAFPLMMCFFTAQLPLGSPFIGEGILPWFLRGERVVTTEHILPPLPDTRLTAFKTGGLVEELRLCEADTCADDVLLRAGQIFERTVSKDDMLTLEKRIEDSDNHVGLAQRVVGLFTFVNFVWLLSIVGITLSVGPVLYHTVSTLVLPFLKALRPLAGTLHRAVVRIVVPLLPHLTPVYEAVVYYVCACLIMYGVSRHGVTDAGFMISLTGAMLCIPAFFFSTTLNLDHDPNSDKSAFAQVINVFAIAMWAPLAVVFESHLLGFCSVVALFGALGFSVVCFGLCYFIGFGSDETMARVLSASVLVLTSFAGVRMASVDLQWFAVFESGFLCMGSVCMYLALLIMASKWYRSTEQYIAMNVTLLVAILAGVLAGNVLHLPAFVNTAYTFSVLFVMEKMTEIPNIFRGPGPYFLILLTSVVAWRCSLFLHQHPRFLLQMVSMSTTSPT